MDIGSGRRHREVRFTVIRHFQPVRIETELLAQVFEIVDRGVGDQIGRSNNVAFEAQRSLAGASKSEVQTAELSHAGQTQVHAPETIS